MFLGINSDVEIDENRDVVVVYAKGFAANKYYLIKYCRGKELPEVISVSRDRGLTLSGLQRCLTPGFGFNGNLSFVELIPGRDGRNVHMVTIEDTAEEKAYNYYFIARKGSGVSYKREVRSIKRELNRRAKQQKPQLEVEETEEAEM